MNKENPLYFIAIKISINSNRKVIGYFKTQIITKSFEELSKFRNWKGKKIDFEVDIEF